MSDLRIQYDEEMVGASHPTKDDTLNRLALVEADTDGHGTQRFLKVRASAPATAAGEGVLYAKTAGGAAELFYRGEDDGQEVQLTAAGLAAAAPPGFLSGLAPSLSAVNQLTLSGGAVDIAGALCRLEEAAAKDFSSLAADAWLYLMAAAPASGVVLGVGNLSLTATAPAWDHGLAGYYDAGKTSRCLGAVRTDGDGDILPFICDGGWFMLADALEILSTTSPATTMTALSAGLPAAFQANRLVSLQGYIQKSGVASAGLLVGHGDTTQSSGAALTLARQAVDGQDGGGQGLYFSNASGQVKYLATSEAAAIIHLRGFRLPAGLAR